MLFLVPGDPVKMMLAAFVTTPDQVAQMRAQLHLDDPIPVQYGRFVTNALRGDLGTSIRSRRPAPAGRGRSQCLTGPASAAQDRR
jgi:ABC-type dipeptide/oligopeptide/nickel transport system permease component